MEGNTLDLGNKNREIDQKLETFILNCVIGKSYFDDCGSQN